MIKTAMVMAAGHGTRMRPLTNDKAKAMVSVAGMPLIDHMLARLAAAGIKRAVVNVHAHADHLQAHLKRRRAGPEIIISDERAELLETGGGVVKAMPLLGDDPILICNIDAIWAEFEPVIEGLLGAWNGAVMDELLLLAEPHASLGYAGAGDFHRDDIGRLTRRAGASAPYIYAGVQIFKPALARAFKEEKFSRNVIWDQTLVREKLFGHVMRGYWMHVGDPDARRAAKAVWHQASDL